MFVVIENKTGVINDPLRPTHITPGSEDICFIWLDFEKWGRTDGRTRREKTAITTVRVWVGLVDQYELVFMLQTEFKHI